MSSIRLINVVMNLKKILFDSNKNVVSRILRERRLAAGLTQAQLAARMQTQGVNLDQQMISRIESNRRFVTDYELACFCRVLKLSTEEALADFYENYGKE